MTTHTYAPKGHRPSYRLNSSVTQRCYAASAIAADGRLHYQVENQPFTAEKIVTFLRTLLEKTTQKVLLIWDGASIHTAQRIRDFLSQDPVASRLFLVQQPHYSPELNADEQVWNYLKNVAMKDLYFPSLSELRQKLLESLAWLATQRQLIENFFRHPDLGFYQSQ